MGYTFQSLRERLLLLVLVASMPVLALIVYSAVAERQAAAQDAERNVQNLVAFATREQAQTVTDTRQLLAILSQLPALQPGASGEECTSTLAKLLESHGHFTNIGVATPDGVIYCSAVPMSESVNISDRSYFVRALASRSFGVGDHQVGRVTGASAINFGFPILDDGGEVAAVVYAALGLSWLNRIVNDVVLSSGSTVTLIDSTGTVLARYPEQAGRVGERLVDTPLVRAVLEGREGAAGILPGLDGVTRFYSFAALLPDNSGSAHFAVGIPEAEVFAEANRALVRNLMLLLVVVLLTLVSAWFGSNAFVIRPLQAIAGAARRLAEGRMDARTGLHYGADELGLLARDFDTMAAALQRGNRALKTLSEGNRAMVRATDEHQLLQQMCRTIVETGGYDGAWTGYFDAERDELRPLAAAGSGDVGDGRQWDRELIAEVLRKKAPVVTRSDQDRPGSCALFPLHDGDAMIGLLAICSTDSGAFNAEELELLRESADDLAYGIATLRTREKHREATETIRKMAYYDGLTGLPNNVYLDDHLHRRLADVSTRGESLALLVLDLDRFREINAALGFNQGDLMLQEVARRLRAVAGPGDLVARMRGDEFAILQLEGDHFKLAQTVIDALDRPFDSGNLTLAISASVGIALFPDHGDDIEHLVRHAGVAMRDAKSSGQRFVIYDASQDRDGARRVTLAGELKRAIDSEDQMVLYYQPKLDMRDGRLEGVEALVRWQHPQRGMIPPDEFITLAEQTGLIMPLTDRLLEIALHQAVNWHRQGYPLRVAVNLSARNLQDPDLPGKLQELLARTGAAPDWLELELTESAIMADPRNALHVLNGLNDSGIRLYIDDFGTGYSSLAYLQRLPVHAMKIDKSFVSDMLKDSDREKIVRSTIDLAHDLDLRVVAEGVETAEVWQRLEMLGCDVAQGYYISRPMPAGDLAAWLQEYGRRPEPMMGVGD